MAFTPEQLDLAMSGDPTPKRIARPTRDQLDGLLGPAGGGLGGTRSGEGVRGGQPQDFEFQMKLDQDNFKLRAQDQSWYEQTGKTLANLIPNVLLGVGEFAGYMGTLGEFGEDRDYSNALTEQMKAWKNPFGETYRENPGELVDFGDSAWWLNTFSQLAESAGAFAIPGAGLGMGFMKGFSGIARGLKAGADGMRAARGLAQVSTAATLAYGEGAMSGAQIYDEVYQAQYRKMMQSGYTSEEAHEQAKTRASDAASTTVQINTAMNTALNMTALSQLFKNVDDDVYRIFKDQARMRPGETTQAFKQRLVRDFGDDSRVLKHLGKRHGLTSLGSEALQEGTEEVNTQYAEAVGRDVGSGDFTSHLEELTTYFDKVGNGEGVLNFALGAVGGVGQTLIIDNIPVHRVIKYDENNKPLYKEDKNIVEGKNGTPAYQTRLVSSRTKNDLGQRQYFSRMRDALVKDFDWFEGKKLELAVAMKEGNTLEAEMIRNEMYSVNNLNAVSMGVTDNWKETYRQMGQVDNSKDLGTDFDQPIAEITSQLAQDPENTDLLKQREDLVTKQAELRGKTQAMVQGLAKSPTDNQYKERTNQAIQDLDHLQTLFDDTQKRFAGREEADAAELADHIFFRRAELYLQKRTLDREAQDIAQQETLEVALDAYSTKREVVRQLSNNLERQVKAFNAALAKGDIRTLTKMAKAYRIVAHGDEDVVKAAEELKNMLAAKRDQYSSEVNALNSALETDSKYSEWKEQHPKGTFQDYYAGILQYNPINENLVQRKVNLQTAQDQYDIAQRNLNVVSSKKGADAFVLAARKHRGEFVKELNQKNLQQAEVAIAKQKEESTAANAQAIQHQRSVKRLWHMIHFMTKQLNDLIDQLKVQEERKAELKKGKGLLSFLKTTPGAMVEDKITSLKAEIKRLENKIDEYKEQLLQAEALVAEKKQEAQKEPTVDDVIQKEEVAPKVDAVVDNPVEDQTPLVDEQKASAALDPAEESWEQDRMLEQIAQEEAEPEPSPVEVLEQEKKDILKLLEEIEKEPSVPETKPETETQTEKAPELLKTEEVAPVMQAVQGAIDTLTEEEQEVVADITKANAPTGTSTTQFVAQQLAVPSKHLKGGAGKVSKFRKIMAKIAKFLSIIGIIWVTANPIADFLGRNNIVTREKSAFVMDVVGLPATLTESSFTETQKDMILALVKNAEAKNQNYVTYAEYPTQGAGTHYKKSAQDSAASDILETNTDEMVVKRSLGQFVFKKISGNRYLVTDSYDFNDAGAQSFSEKIEDLQKSFADSSMTTYGKIRRVGTAFGSKPGEGSIVAIEIEDKAPSKEAQKDLAKMLSISLLALVRRKRENGEPITQEEIQGLKDRLKELDGLIAQAKQPGITETSVVTEPEAQPTTARTHYKTLASKLPRSMQNALDILEEMYEDPSLEVSVDKVSKTLRAAAAVEANRGGMTLSPTELYTIALSFRDYVQAERAKIAEPLPEKQTLPPVVQTESEEVGENNESAPDSPVITNYSLTEYEAEAQDKNSHAGKRKIDAMTVASRSVLFINVTETTPMGKMYWRIPVYQNLDPRANLDMLVPGRIVVGDGLEFQVDTKWKGEVINDQQGQETDEGLPLTQKDQYEDYLGEDGKVRMQVLEGEARPAYMNVPIKIIHVPTGKLVGYMHRTDWVDAKYKDSENHQNIEDTLYDQQGNVIDNMAIQLQRIMTARKKIVQAHNEGAGQVFRSSVSFRHPGTVMKNVEVDRQNSKSKVKYQTAKKLLPDNSLQFGIVNQAKIGIGKASDFTLPINNTDESLQRMHGAAVVLLPMPNQRYTAVPLDTRKLGDLPSNINTILKVIELHLKPVLSEQEKKEVEKLGETGFNIRDAKDLKDFINQYFTYTQKFTQKDLVDDGSGKPKRFVMDFATVNTEGRAVIKLGLLRSNQVKPFYVALGKDGNLSEESVATLRRGLATHDKNVVFSSGKIKGIGHGDPIVVPSVDKNGRVSLTRYPNYNDYLKTFAYTYVLGTHKHEGNYLYSANPVVEYDTAPIFDTKVAVNAVQAKDEVHIPDGLMDMFNSSVSETLYSAVGTIEGTTPVTLDALTKLYTFTTERNDKTPEQVFQELSLAGVTTLAAGHNPFRTC